MVHPTDNSTSRPVAIVTGAGRGVGAAVALALGKAGYAVCTADLNPDRAFHTARQITDAGGEAFGWQTDVSNKFQAASMIETTRDRYGRLDVLAHFAHVHPNVPALKMDEWDWRRVVEVNLTGTFICVQLAARVMADEGGGRIALMGLSPDLTWTGEAAYAASLSALPGLMAAFQNELSGSGVRLTLIPLGDSEEAAKRVIGFCAR